MHKTNKYKRLEKRGRIYELISAITTVIGFTEIADNDKKLSKCLTAIGVVSSTASFVNYLQRLEHYGVDTSPSDSSVFGEMVRNVVVEPLLCTWGVAKFLGDNNKHW